MLQKEGAVGREGGREDHWMDWAGLGACGGSGDGILFENVCMDKLSYERAGI